MKRENGGPAFPQIPGGTYEGGEGMTLRDYFAAKAMSGIVGSIDSEDNYQRIKHLAKTTGLKSVSEWIARDAYKQADAMIAERLR